MPQPRTRWEEWRGKAQRMERRPQKAVVIEGEQGEEAGVVGLGIVGGGQEQTQEKRWGSASEKIEQAVVDEKKLGADFHGRDVAYFSKFVKVTRGGGPLGDAASSTKRIFT